MNDLTIAYSIWFIVTLYWSLIKDKTIKESIWRFILTSGIFTLFVYFFTDCLK